MWKSGSKLLLSNLVAAIAGVGVRVLHPFYCGSERWLVGVERVVALTHLANFQYGARVFLLNTESYISVRDPPYHVLYGHAVSCFADYIGIS